MDVGRVLAALRREHAQIEEVIVNLERLQQVQESRRGRPRSAAAGTRKRGRPRGSKNRTSLRSDAALSSSLPRAMAAGQTALLDDSAFSSELM